MILNYWLNQLMTGDNSFRRWTSSHIDELLGTWNFCCCSTRHHCFSHSHRTKVLETKKTQTLNLTKSTDYARVKYQLEATPWRQHYKHSQILTHFSERNLLVLWRSLCCRLTAPLCSQVCAITLWSVYITMPAVRITLPSVCHHVAIFGLTLLFGLKKSRINLG